MPGSSIHATVKDSSSDISSADSSSSGNSDRALATLKETQASSERMLVAIGKIERALDEKFKRDAEEKNKPDPAIGVLNAEITQLKLEITKLKSENNELHQAVITAGDKLDNIIESLGAQLDEDK